MNTTTNTNENTTYTIEDLLKKQTKPMSADAVEAARAEFVELPVELTSDGRYYYHTNVKYQGTTVMSIWFKTLACRVCINKGALEKYHDVFAIDLDTRKAMKPESRGSENYVECPGEFVMTLDEIKATLSAIAEMATKAVEEKQSEEETPKPEKKVRKPRQKKAKKEEVVEDIIENAPADALEIVA